MTGIMSVNLNHLEHLAQIDPNWHIHVVSDSPSAQRRAGKRHAADKADCIQLAFEQFFAELYVYSDSL